MGCVPSSGADGPHYHLPAFASKKRFWTSHSPKVRKKPRHLWNRHHPFDFRPSILYLWKATYHRILWYISPIKNQNPIQFIVFPTGNSGFLCVFELSGGIKSWRPGLPEVFLCIQCGKNGMAKWMQILSFAHWHLGLDFVHWCEKSFKPRISRGPGLTHQLSKRWWPNIGFPKTMDPNI